MTQVWLLLALVTGTGHAQGIGRPAEAPPPRFVAPNDTTVWTPPADTLPAPGVPTRHAAHPIAESRVIAALDSLGLENLSEARLAARPLVVFEDRRYRHPAQALGRVARVVGEPFAAVLRRHGIAAAFIEPATDGRPARVLYPSDGDFPALPEGPFARPTHRRLELFTDVRYSYELGQIDQPLQWSLDLQWEADYDPWPGAHLRASWLTPVHDDFGPDLIHPDAGRPRPGPTLIEQYLWLGRLGLASGTAGVLGGDRWGGSLGLARPFAGGMVLVDAQGDLTGAFSVSDSGVVYSEANRFDGFAGLTIRPPQVPGLALRGRVARYLREDRGVEGTVERRFGDVTLAFIGQQTGGFRQLGVDLTLPVPPMLRPTHWPVSLLPSPTFTLTYRTEATPIGELPGGVASRERFLEGTAATDLAGQSYRYRAERDGIPHRRQTPALEPVSFAGMSGFITTPSASVLPDGQVAMGYSRLPKAAAWDHRGTNTNEVWYGAVGFLPRIEAGLRWTVIPGLRAFDEVLSGTPLVDADRMVSGRIELLRGRGWRPGLAAGSEDVFGTRRFHSEYLVAGIQPTIFGLRTRASAGYAPRVLAATHYTLDGGFGALELAVGRLATPVVEYDSERWNAGLGVHLGPYVHLRAAWFDLKYASLGGGISLTL